LTTNKTFGKWNQVFLNAAGVITLVDRLAHRSEILALIGNSYRLKEAHGSAAHRCLATQARRRAEQGFALP
jgi:DNA replication protein DnaC